MSAALGTTTTTADDLCAVLGHWLREYDPPVDPPLVAQDARTLLGVIRSAGWSVVDLPEVDYYDLDRRPVFTSFLFEVTAYAATSMVELWLPEQDVDSLFMDAVEARSLAAALLAAADASEETP